MWRKIKSNESKILRQIYLFCGLLLACLELGLPLKWLVLTWQRYGGEAGGERLAQGLQVLLEEPVASPLLHHVTFQPLYGPAHALNVFLQRRVTLLVLHVRLTQLPHLSLTCCWGQHKETETTADQRSSERRYSETMWSVPSSIFNKLGEVCSF